METGESAYYFGKNSVFTILETSPNRVFKVMVADELKQDKRLNDLMTLTRQCGRTLQIVPRQKLDQLGDSLSPPHQGVVAMVTPKPLLTLYDLEEKLQTQSDALILMLDEITDPRNLGALIRVAAGAGALAVIIPKVKGAGMTPAVFSASAGTMEFVDIVVVPNLTEAIKRLKECGVWWVGAAQGDNTIPYSQYQYSGHTGVVIGNEGDGMKRLVRETCDQLVEIPLSLPVESLNVSVAAGIILFEARRQQAARALN
jgi:23S rRNA (guanosine2251-2'-O)-methyltransferase